MITTSSEESRKQDSSTSEEKTLSDSSYHLEELPKITINKNITLFFVKDCSYVSLTPIIPTNKIGTLFKLYKVPLSKEDLITKIKTYISNQEAKIDKIYTLNNIRIHKSRGNIIIIDQKFNKECIELSKQSNNALQIIADKIALSLYNNKKIKYKYEKSTENDKAICVIAFMSIEDDISVKSEFFESEKKARNDANKKIIMKYLPKKIVKEILGNIGKMMDLEDKIKFIKKERYEQHLLEAGCDRKLLNKKRNLSIEEFSKRLPYYNMLQKGKNKNKEGINKYKKNNMVKKNNKNNKIILDEDDEEEFFVNTEGTPLNEILLGDPIIVNKHLRDFKYTPLKLFEMIRDSEKFRGIDFKIEYSNINDKNYSVKFKSTIISQKLGIKVEGFGNSKEEAGNKCSLNLLSILFKNIFKTYYQVHDYFEHKNRRYLDIILKNENDIDNNDNIVDNENNEDSEEENNENEECDYDVEENSFNYGKKGNKNENEEIIDYENNIKKENENENIQRSKFANWINYSNKRQKLDEDSDYWCPKKRVQENIKKSPSPIYYNERELSQRNHFESKKSSKKSNNESQESYVKFDFDQIISSEFMNNTSSSDINIINNLNKYNISNSSNTEEIDDLIKNSILGISGSSYSISNGTKKNTK